VTMVGCLRKILLLLFALRPEAQDRVRVASVDDHVQLASATDDGHGIDAQTTPAQGNSLRKGTSALLLSEGNVSGLVESLPNETVSASILLPHAEWPREPDAQEHTVSSMQQVMMVLAVGSSYLVHASPSCAVQTMRKRGTVSGRDSAPFVALAIGCIHWTVYGLLRYLRSGEHKFLVIFVGYAPGSLLGTYYTIIYWLSCDEKDSLRDLKRFLCAAVAVVVVESFIMSMQPARQALKFLGFVSSLLSTIVSISTVSTVRTVLRTRSVASLPTEIVVTGFLSNILWAVIAVRLADSFLIFTIVLGLICGVVGLGLTLRFHQRTRWLWEPKETFMAARELDDWTSGVFLRTPLNLEE